MRRLGIRPEQHLAGTVNTNPRFGMGQLCNCKDVRAKALRKATSEVLQNASYNEVYEVPHDVWHAGPCRGLWNDVKAATKRILKHKRQCKNRKAKKVMGPAALSAGGSESQ